MKILVNGIQSNLRFSSAHVIPGHESCGFIHGHSYFVDVEIEGERAGDFEFVVDFKDVKKYGTLKKDVGEILRKLCEQKGVEIIEAEACKDHIHMLVCIPPHISVAQFMGYLKGKSTLMIFDRHANLKYKYGSREFWCRGYYVDTVGRNKKVIAEYIRNQLEEDYTKDQITMKEFIDPFTGNKNK